MPKNPKNLKPKVFFNASVILAGLKSPTGGSGKVLSWSKNHKIDGVISEIVADEVVRHDDRISVKPTHVQLVMKIIFRQIQIAPEKENVVEFSKIVIDPGDAHVLASCSEAKADYLITLDKKHLLILQKKIRWMKIVSPGELIRILS